MPMRFTHTRLLVDDVPGTLAFYRDVLGFTVTFADEGNYADLRCGDAALALFLRSAMEETINATHSGTTGNDQVVLILSVESVDATARELAGKGVTFVTPPTDMPDWGIRVAHFRDPAGTLIEINHSL
jgi:lactoylglutathione lyase